MEDSTVIKTFPSGSKLVVSVLDHAIYLAPRLRPYDMLECHANGTDPLSALADGITLGNETYTVLAPNGMPVAMLGTGRSLDTNVPYIWLLGSDEFETLAYDFLRASRGIVQWLVEPYGKVYNYVYADYDKSVKWLMWVGASFLDKVEIRGLPFYRFMITSI